EQWQLEVDWALELYALLKKNEEGEEIVMECAQFIKDSVTDIDLKRLVSVYRNDPQTLSSFSVVLSLSNCCSLYQWALETDAQSLLPIIVRFVRENYVEVITGDKFALMESDLCKRLMIEAFTA